MKSTIIRLFCVSILAFPVSPLNAQLTDADIAALQERAEAEGWTFTVGRNPATERPLSALAGTVRPLDAPPPPTIDPASLNAVLPSRWDWREHDGVTPVRDQGACGSCWAFGAAGILESAILLQDQVEEDLSEQWLVSCTDAGSCEGGWHGLALEYFLWARDYCGNSGAVLEAAFPYAYVGGVEYPAHIEPCGCPYDHSYWIDSWGYVEANTWYYDMPNVLAIKQAILDYGPVAVSVYVDNNFVGYQDGVFEPGPTGEYGWLNNHCVILVGWDDDQGINGIWYMKNSWGENWGEDGYMRIGYGSSDVGYDAAYVDYGGTSYMRVVPLSDFLSTMEEGGPVFPQSKRYMLINNGSLPLRWEATSGQDWIDITPSSGIIPVNQRRPILVTINDEALELGLGVHEDTLVITDLDADGSIERDISLSVVERRPAAIMTVIEPREAAESGAQWRIANVEGATWYNSGEIVTGVYIDDYELEFSDVPGWFSPVQVRITAAEMVSQQITVRRVEYIPEAAGTYTAIAGADQSVPADNAEVILNGRATGGVRPYVFTWSVKSSPPDSRPVIFAKMTSLNAYPTYLATIGGQPAVPGDYVFELIVTDARGLVETDTLTVTVLDGSSTGSQTADATPATPTDSITGGGRPAPSETPDVRPCGNGGEQALAMTFVGLLLVLFISRRRLL